MDSLGTLKDKIVITMAMITIFHISFKSNIILLGSLRIALFISRHLAISSIFVLLKLEALLRSQLTGGSQLPGAECLAADSSAGQPPPK